MRLVAVAHAYPRWDGDFSGAFIERLNKELRNRSHSIAVVVPADEGRSGELVHSGIPITRVRYAPASRETLAYRGTMTNATKSLAGLTSFASLIASQAGAVFNKVRRIQADLIHAHWWVPGGVSAFLASAAAHRPFVVTLHGTDVAILKKSEAARKMARVVLKKASAVTAVSKFLAEQAGEVAGFDPACITSQPMPLDVERYDRSSRGGGGVVTVGRLVQQKNLAVLLEAIAALKGKGKTIRLRIVGDGPERTALAHLAKHLRIEASTEFMGAVTPEAIPEAIGDADVFVFPAMEEGFGLACAEALMLGVPVIAAHQGGGVKDIVPSEGAGRLVDATSAQHVARAIEDVLDSPRSLALARERGAMLKTQLSPPAVAAVFEDIYRKVICGA